MTTAEPPDSTVRRPPGPGLASLVEDVGTEAAPAVVAVVVSRDSGPWLEETLRSLSAQDYPRLTTVVVDAGSETDPAPRVAAVVPGAAVRRVPASFGFGRAANEALTLVDDATLLLVCHDDVVVDPDAVRLLVEEAYRSNAGVVGPKLVEADNPQVLLEVGRAIDRYGAPHTGIEPGELDQEQHDGVRDVFYVSEAAMLVRTDLFRELGGFEPQADPGAEDIDLCWRARLAGARVLVAPDARVRHHEAAEEKPDRRDVRAEARARLRTVLTCYSFWTLLRVVPIGLVIAFGEAIVSLLTRRRGRARAVLGAWWWNLRHLGEIRRNRRRVQSLRRIHDSELREFQVRGSAQVRSYVAHQLHTEERLHSISEASRSAFGTASTTARQPVAVVGMIVVAVFLFGSRDLVFGDVPAVGTLARWPGIFDLLSTYASGWRYTGLGSPAAAPPAFVFMAGLATPLFGAVGLARTLVVVGAIPLGAIGVYRLTRPWTGSAAAAGIAALVYSVNPVPRNAIANGRLGPLVLYALGPFLLARVLRASSSGRRSESRSSSRARLFLGTAVLLAVATAFFVLAPLWLAAVALGVLLAGGFVGGGSLGVRMLGVSVVVTLGAVVLLLPWSLELVGGDPASLGFAFRPALTLGDVLRFQTGPSGAGWAAWGILAAASLSLAIATGERLVWASRAWAIALIGFALVWVPAQWFPSVSVPAPEAALSLAALGLAAATGLGAAALFEGDLRRARFGWRQPVVAVAGAGVLLAGCAFAADALDGRWHAPRRGWEDALSFLDAERSQGGFRVLWVGDPQVLPLEPMLADDGVGFLLTRNGPGGGRGLFRASERSGDRVVGDAVDLVAAGQTNRLGHLVAPMGVRFVAVPERPGPGAGATVVPPAGVADGLGDQTDLVRLGSEPGITMYENAAWAATRATVAANEEVPLASDDPLRAALRTELDAAGAVKGSLDDSAPTGPGTLLWAEAHNSEWKATAAGQTLEHVEPFGLTNGYVLTERDSVSITYGGQLRRYAAIALQVALWVAVFVIWRRARPRVRS
jgi:GT2 family glycosyltransferase